MSTNTHTTAYASDRATPRGGYSSEAFREYMRGYNPAALDTVDRKPASERLRAAHDKGVTPQGRAYVCELEHAHNALMYYGPATRVDRDGGTIEYHLHDRETFRETVGTPNMLARVTFSRSEALAWYKLGGLVLVKTTAGTTPREIWNAPRWLGRLYAGNGRVKFYKYGRDAIE